ncbi:hypothetical protein [Janthinobacterium sp.]|uniref:hypothetical protein n=1 Tax=Janthinobacterium sp. TaxID=1871054 RepID=UPI00293D3E95|nr:hypothetical protein [Janthinobacterium sp.]
MKKSITNLTCHCAVAVALAGVAAAASADGWVFRSYDGIPTAALEYKGQRIEDGNRAAYQSVIDARNQLYSGLQSQLYSKILEKVRGQEGYDWHSVVIRGPLELDITPGSPASGPAVALGGLSVELKMHFSRSIGPISGSCTVTANSGVLNLAGNLDASSGALTNLRIVNLSPTTSRDCSTSISWIPLIGQIVDNFIDGKVDSALNGAISAAMGASQQVFKPVQFAGLNSAIPPGKYVYQGFDAGQYIVNNLAYLIASTNVRIRFSPAFKGNSPSPYQDPVDDGGTQRKVVQRDEAFSITLPNVNNGQLKFTAYQETRFNANWECVPRRTNCTFQSN